MSKKNLISVVLTVVAYVIILIAVIGISAVLAEEITAQLALSWLFLFIPYVVLCLLHVLSTLDKVDNIMQNNMLIGFAVVYLILAIIITVILNLFQVSIKAFSIIEIIIMVMGLVLIISGFLAKNHIENN